MEKRQKEKDVQLMKKRLVEVNCVNDKLATRIIAALNDTSTWKIEEKTAAPNKSVKLLPQEMELLPQCTLQDSKELMDFFTLQTYKYMYEDLMVNKMSGGDNSWTNIQAHAITVGEIRQSYGAGADGGGTASLSSASSASSSSSSSFASSSSSSSSASFSSSSSSASSYECHHVQSFGDDEDDETIDIRSGHIHSAELGKIKFTEEIGQAMMDRFSTRLSQNMKFDMDKFKEVIDHVVVPDQTFWVQGNYQSIKKMYAKPNAFVQPPPKYG